jgi:ribonuclease VapC
VNISGWFGALRSLRAFGAFRTYHSPHAVGFSIGEDHLDDIVNVTSKGYMSIINWGEIYYNTFRVQGKKTAESVVSQLDRYPIEIVDVDRSLTYQAATFKGLYKIAYTDCFVAALALRFKASVVTGDREFKKLEKDIDVEWIV